MPIRSLDLNRGAAQPPRLGKLRKGDPKQQKERDGQKYETYGADRDTFRVTFEPQYAALQPIFDDLYTAAPAELRNVMLLGTTADDTFEYWLEEHSAATLLHRCDGEQQVLHFENGSYSKQPIACEKVAGHKCNCTERGYLKVVLMDFTIAAGVWGHFVVETGSIHDILSLSESLRFINNFQDLQGLRWVLGRAPRTVSVPNPKKAGGRMRTTKNLLYLMVEPEQTKQFLVAALQQRDQRLLSGEVDGQTGEIISPAPQIAIPATVPAADDELPEVDSVLSYDLESVKDLTAHLFDHPAHQDNAIMKMRKDGELTDDLSDEQAVAAIKANRARRAQEEADKEWRDAKYVKGFVGMVQTVYPKMTPTEILETLNTGNDQPVSKFSELEMTRDKAWALVLLRGEGSLQGALEKSDKEEIIAALYDLDWEASDKKEIDF